MSEKLNGAPKPLPQIFRKFMDLFFGVFEANCDVGKYPLPKGGSGGASKEVSDMVKNNFDSPYLRKESSVSKTLRGLCRRHHPREVPGFASITGGRLLESSDRVDSIRLTCLMSMQKLKKIDQIHDQSIGSSSIPPK